jgi:hypothetical protein
MTIIDGWELEELIEKRPRLKEELYRLGEPLEVWKMNDQATTRAADIAGKKTFLLLAKVRKLDGKERYVLIMSQPGKGAANSWLFNPADLPDKPSWGRPVTYGAEAREKAKALQKEGLSIRAIAKAMGASTFTIQRLLKTE